MNAYADDQQVYDSEAEENRFKRALEIVIDWKHKCLMAYPDKFRSL